jgi:hypothetical protein
MTATATSARARSRLAEPAADATPRHTAKLIEAAQYHLIGRDGARDQVFQRGEEVAVSEATFDHLAEQTRLVTHKEPGRVVQERRRLFLLKDPDGNALPRTLSEEVRMVGGADEPDPWA